MNWTENGSQVSTSPQYSFAARASRTLVANFSPTTTYTLSVSAINGVITKNPDQPNYPPGSQVTLSALPFAGYQFAGWSGDANRGENPLTVTLDGNKTITANFTTSTPGQIPDFL